MTEETSECLSNNALHALLTGDDETAISETVVQHLANCPQCTNVFRHLDINDPVVTALHQSAPELFSDEEVPSVAALMETLRLLRPTKFASVAKDDTEQVLRMLMPTDRDDALGMLGPFLVRRVLGSGGMGFVLAAADEQLGREVALKVMQPALATTADAKERFLREARAMAALEDDHIVTIHQVGQDRSIPYFAMPILKGETVESKMHRDVRFSTKEVIQLGKQAALGLAAAHRQGLIHRDIKPGNIWWESISGGGYRVKLLDFGLVRAVDQEVDLTGTGIVAGTPAYMAPEQARGEKIDERSDLFSLGCVMFQACTGDRPWSGRTPTATLLALANEPHRRVLELNQNAPSRLAMIIEKLLEKDPARRYQSASHLVEALSLLERQPDAPVIADVVKQRTDESIRDERSSGKIGSSSTTFPKASLFGPRRLAFVGLGMVILGLLVWSVVIITVQTKDALVTIKIDDDLPTKTEVSVEKAIAKTLPIETDDLGDDIRLSIAADLEGGILPGIIPQPKSISGVRRWQLETIAPRGDVHCVAWSPLGDRVACGTATGQIRIYDPTGGKLINLIAAHTGGVLALDWSRDGEWIVSGGQDGRARIWRPNGLPGPTLKGHSSWIHSVAFHPDNQRIATGGSGEESTVRIWNLAGQQLAVIRAHTNTVTELDWTDDGELLATSSWDGTAKIWSNVGDLVADIGDINDSAVLTVAWTSDGTILTTGTINGGIRLWDRGGKPVDRFIGHSGWVHSLAWNKQGLLASASEDGGIRIWDRLGKQISTEKTHSGRITDVQWTHDGQRLAAATSEPAIHVRDLKNTSPLDIRGVNPPLRAVAWSADGKIAIAGDDLCVRLFDKLGTHIGVVAQHTAPVYALAFSNDGSLLASSGWDRKVHVWDIAQATETVFEGANPIAWNPVDNQLAYCLGKKLRLWSASGESKDILENESKIASVAWTPDGTQITTGDFDGRIRHWSLTGEMLAERKLQSLVFTLAWHPTLPLLACGSAADAQVRIWDERLQPVRALAGHALSVMSVNWSRDGKRLVSGGGDGALRLWDTDGKPLYELRPSSAVMHGVCFSLDGRTVAGVATDGRLSTMDVVTGRPGFVSEVFRDQRSLTFSSNGDVIDGDLQLQNSELIVLADLIDGGTTTYGMDDFKTLHPHALAERE